MDLQGWFQVEAAENRKLRSYHFMLLFGVGYREREREREREFFTNREARTRPRSSARKCISDYRQKYKSKRKVMCRNNSIKKLQVKKHEDADNFQIDCMWYSTIASFDNLIQEIQFKHKFH
jgi:hypothetical protein